jgi:hypothetical protein
MTKYQTLNDLPQTKYTNWYTSLINKAQHRDSNDDTYYENHHIIPKFLGGSNYKFNIVALTIKEHYISHLILVQICKQISIKSTYQSIRSVFAFHMSSCKKNNYRQLFMSSRRIISNRILLTKHFKGQPAHNKGKQHSIETKQKMSDNHWLKKNPNLHPMLGKTHSLESITKMRNQKTKVRYKVVCPKGLIYDNVSIEAFVEKHQLNRDAIRKYPYGNPIPDLYPGRECLAHESRRNTIGWTFFRY